jgi:hypothetical protein
MTYTSYVLYSQRMNSGAPNWPAPWPFHKRLAGPYRFLSGRPLNGHRYTDATFRHPGTMATDLSGRASTWQMWPGWKRAAVARWPWPVVATDLAMATGGHPWLAMATGMAMATPYALMAKTAVASRGNRKTVIEPVAMAVARVLNKRMATGHGHEWVAIPRDMRDNPAAVATIYLPANWPGDRGDMARVTRTVAAKMAMPDLVANWELAGARPYVEFSNPERPPAEVDLAMAIRKAELVKADELAMGIGTRGAMTAFSLALESPHLLLAAGSGAGKSVLLAWLVGQFMRRGYGVAVFDAKMISHMWLRRIPGVLYAGEAQEQHDGLIWLDNEVMRRARFIASGGNPDTLTPLVVVLEEMVGATNKLRQYWQSIKGTGDPMKSPALNALTNISSMGRELRVHVLMAGQSMTANASGGVENRENFGGRALARATRNQWKMLAGQIKNPPLKKTEPGRWHLVVGDEVREFQVPFFDLKNEQAVAELIAWATGGADVPDVPAMMINQPSTSGNAVSDAVSSTELVTLSAYADTRPDVTIGQLRNWAARFPDFPVPADRGDKNAGLFDPFELDRFVGTRVGSA